MFDSVILEVAIGLVLFYLLLSLICTAVNELVARAFAMRSNTLEQGIRNLLNDPNAHDGLTKKLYDHPLIAKLALRGKGYSLMGRSGKPSYISSRSFALALFDVIAPSGQPQTAGEVKSMVEEKPEDGDDVKYVKRTLRTLVAAAGGDPAKARERVEVWFDDAMDRVSGWYKRKAQLIVLTAGLLMVIALNADTLMLANSLAINPALRASVVAAAEARAKEPPPPGSGISAADVGKLYSELEQLALPIGWVTPSKDVMDPRVVPSDIKGWAYKILGLLFSTVAISLGAPFWFDLLKRFVNLRGAGQPAKATEPVVAAPVEGK